VYSTVFLAVYWWMLCWCSDRCNAGWLQPPHIGIRPCLSQFVSWTTRRRWIDSSLSQRHDVRHCRHSLTWQVCLSSLLNTQYHAGVFVPCSFLPSYIL